MATFITGNAQHQAAADDSYLTIFRYTDNRAPNGSTLTRVTCFFHAVAGSTGMVKRFTANADGTFNVRDIEDFTVPAVASLPYEQPFEVVCSDLVPTTGDHYYGIYLDDPAEAPLDLIASSAENYCLASEATGNSVDFGVSVPGDYQIECRFELALEPSTISNCLGDVGDIIDDVMGLANDTEQRFVKDWMVLGAINRCTEYISQRGLFTADTTLTWASAAYLDLLTEIPRVEHVYEVRRTTDNRALEVCSTRGEFDELQVLAYANQVVDYTDAVPHMFIERNRLYIYPQPSSGDTFSVHHSEVPADRECLSNYTLSLPVAHKMLYVFFCRAWLCMIDRGKPESTQDFQTYWQLFQNELKALNIQDFPSGYRLMAQ